MIHGDRRGHVADGCRPSISDLRPFKQDDLLRRGAPLGAATSTSSSCGEGISTTSEMSQTRWRERSRARPKSPIWQPVRPTSTASRCLPAASSELQVRQRSFARATPDTDAAARLLEERASTTRASPTPSPARSPPQRLRGKARVRMQIERRHANATGSVPPTRCSTASTRRPARGWRSGPRPRHRRRRSRISAAVSLSRRPGFDADRAEGLTLRRRTMCRRALLVLIAAPTVARSRPGFRDTRFSAAARFDGTGGRFIRPTSASTTATRADGNPPNENRARGDRRRRPACAPRLHQHPQPLRAAALATAETC